MQQIGDVIFHYRMKRGLTQRELSLRVDVPQPNISNIEKGKQDVTIGTLQRIAAVLGCTLTEFFQEVEKEPKAEFDRARIEQLAEAIAGGDLPKDKTDAEIVLLFRDLKPHPAAQVRIGRTYKAWRQLRALLPKQAISSLLARVRDAEMRSGHEQA